MNPLLPMTFTPAPAVSSDEVSAPAASEKNTKFNLALSRAREVEQSANSSTDKRTPRAAEGASTADSASHATQAEPNTQESLDPPSANSEQPSQGEINTSNVSEQETHLLSLPEGLLGEGENTMGQSAEKTASEAHTITLQLSEPAFATNENVHTYILDNAGNAAALIMQGTANNSDGVLGQRASTGVNTTTLLQTPARAEIALGVESGVSVELEPLKTRLPGDKLSMLTGPVSERNDVKNLASQSHGFSVVSIDKTSAEKAGAEGILKMGKVDSTMAMIDKIQVSSESIKNLQSEQSAQIVHGAFTSSQTAIHDNARMQMPLNISFGHTGWSGQVAERAAMMSFQKIQVADMQLDPPELGALQVKVSINSEQQASVTFVSPHIQVREALDQSVMRLRELLEQQGVDLVDVNVSDQQAQDNKKEGAEESAELSESAIVEDKHSQTIETTSHYGVDFYA